jgi:DNA polymerase III subunit gamma/tau
MSWIRQYRPRQIKQLHLTSVREQLQSLLKKGKLPQVMLFAGPKGTGKTSTARIIGALLNDKKNKDVVTKSYLKPSSGKLDPLKEPSSNEENTKITDGQSYIVQELDAASNRGIDEVRNLKERAALSPQDGLISVFILDEAHMLTAPAFNALLKLLEEPPPHAVFILATTEAHKIPATITSRCQVIQFHKASQSEMLDALKTVVKAEDLKVADKALEEICLLADGSFRDAVKLLELVADETGQVTSKKIAQFLGGSLQEQAWQLVESIIDKDAKEVVIILEALRKAGISQSVFLTQVLTELHQDLLSALEVTSSKARLSASISKFLLQELSSISISQTSPIPLLSLELKALDIVFRAIQKNGSSGSGSNSGSSSVKTKSPNTTPVDSSNHVLTTPVKTIDNDPKPVAETLTKSRPVTGDCQQLFENWDKFLNLVTKHNSTIAALLRSAKPIEASDNQVLIHVYYRFHLEQINNPKTHKLLSVAMKEIAGGPVHIECQLETLPTQADLIEPEVVGSLTQIATQALM